MKYFAIRQKSSGFLMPEIVGAKGYTWTEPQPWYLGPPRLFSSEAGAARALGHWLQGQKYNTGDFVRQTLPVPSRAAQDMEIVSIEIAVSA